jgi:PEP-CTERM motif
MASIGASSQPNLNSEEAFSIATLTPGAQTIAVGEMFSGFGFGSVTANLTFTTTAPGDLRLTEIGSPSWTSDLGLQDAGVQNVDIPGGSLVFFSWSLTYTAVPEPSTWEMMLLGFVGLGWTGYRRARITASTTAPTL